MKHILLIGHGSRDAEGIEQFHTMVEKVRAEMPHYPVSFCFLELAEPDIQTGIRNCVNDGAEEIITLPVILSKAKHFQSDIPEELEQARQEHPQIKIHYGEHLGSHALMMDVLLASLRQAAPDTNASDAEVVLVSQGSSEEEGNEELKELAAKLGETIENPNVHASFMVMTEPKLHQTLQEVTAAKAGQVIIIPCFLFTGTMYKKIHETMEDFRGQFPKTSFELADCFGICDLFIEIIVDRLIEQIYQTVEEEEKISQVS